MSFIITILIDVRVQERVCYPILVPNYPFLEELSFPSVNLILCLVKLNSHKCRVWAHLTN